MAKSKDIAEYYSKILNNETGGEESPSSDALPHELLPWMQKESDRLRGLYSEEENARRSGFRFIAGVDEVGRGPAAGPLAACAVVFDAFRFLPGLNDSKKITHELRKFIDRGVQKFAISCSVAWVSVEEIDRFNIHNAALMGMRRALEGLSLKPDLVMVDGKFTIPGISTPQKSYIKGDGRIFSIAAASIVAKEARDREMRSYDREYPGYGFASHKGYCTAEHMEALRRLGICPIHRKSYKPIRDIEPAGEQLTFI